MVLEYFKSKVKPKNKEPGPEDETKSPVLNADDEAFLSKIASESAAPSNPEKPTIILDNGHKVRGKDAQVALMAGADQVPLPVSPPEVDENAGGAKQKQHTNYWNFVPGLPQTGSWTAADWSPYIPSLPRRPSKKQQQQQQAAADLAAAAQVVKEGDVPEVDAEEAEQEKEDLTAVLDQLNLSATTTRTFSLSKESAKLMEEFTQVLKDVVNGVPTAYDDMDKLLRRRDKEIRSIFNNMPPWLQTLVKSLPAKMATSLAPEVMAAAGDKPGADMQAKMKLDPDAKVGASAAQPNPDLEKLKKRAKARIPSVKRLIGEKGAVAAMLRNILNFLKLRFPAFITGTNVLMSIAVFLLLFVFWYCHKRGRETRLEREQGAGSELKVPEAEDEDESDANDTAVEDSTLLETPGEDGSPVDGSAGRQRLPSVLSKPDPKDVPLPASAAA